MVKFKKIFIICMSLITCFYLSASQNDQYPDNKWDTSFATPAQLQTIALEFSDKIQRFNLSINGCQIKNIQDLSGHLDSVIKYFFDEEEKKEKLIQGISELHYSNVHYAYLTQISVSTIDVLKNALAEKEQEMWSLKINNNILKMNSEEEKQLLLDQHNSVLIERNNVIAQLELKNKMLETQIKKLNEEFVLVQAKLKAQGDSLIVVEQQNKQLKEHAKLETQLKKIKSLEEHNRELQEQIYNETRKNNQLKNNLTIVLLALIIYGFYYSFNILQAA